MTATPPPHRKYLVGLFFALGILFSGCSTFASYASDRLYDFIDTPIEAVYYDDATLEDKKLTLAILKEMKKQSFNVADQNKADCILFVKSGQESFVVQGMMPVYNTAISNTNASGFVGNQYMYGSATTTTGTTTMMPTQNAIHTKHISVNVNCKKDDKFEHVFIGSAVVGMSEYSDIEKRAMIIKNLVKLMKEDNFSGIINF